MRKILLYLTVLVTALVSAQTPVDIGTTGTRSIEIAEQFGEKVTMKIIRMGKDPNKQLYSVWLNIPNYKGCGGDPEAFVMFRFHDGTNVYYQDRAAYDCTVHNISIVINPSDFTGKHVKDIVTNLTPDIIYTWRSWYSMEEMLSVVKNMK